MPRIPHESEDLTGKVCVGSVGRPFIITGTVDDFSFDSGTRYWVGLGLDGKGTAATSKPVVIAESGHEFHDKLLKRFGGKMSFNG